MKKRYIVVALGIFCVASVSILFSLRTNNNIEELAQQATVAYYESISYTMEEGSYDEISQTAIFEVTFPDLQTIYQQVPANQSEAAVIKAMTKQMDKYSKTVSVEAEVLEIDGKYIPQVEGELGELLYKELDELFLTALLDAELEPIELVVNSEEAE